MLRKTGNELYYLIYSLLFLCVLLEVLCNTFWITPGTFTNRFTGYLVAHRQIVSLVYFFAGICAALLFMSGSRLHSIPSFKYQKILRVLLIFILLTVAIAFCYEAGAIFSNTPFNYYYADMLPVIKVMNERFLHHEEVYAIMPQFWNGTMPVYLPAMWMPYLFTSLAHADIRWTSVGFLFIGVIVIVYSVPWKRWTVLSLISLIPLLLLGYHIACIDTRLIAWNEESVVIFYYLLLAFSLTRRSNLLKGLAISLCLLSRFSFAGWLPFFFVFEFFFVSKKDAVWIGGVTLLTCVLLMWISQGFYQLPVFLHLHSYYFDAVMEKNNGWKYGPLLKEGLGLVKFVGYENIGLAQSISISVALLFPVAGLVTARKMKGSKDYFLIGMLKICLVLFYNLLIVPYLYLFFVPTFLSIFLLYRFSAAPPHTD